MPEELLDGHWILKSCTRPPYQFLSEIFFNQKILRSDRDIKQ
ncbi:unnamed protein product, partial [Acanthoscelides obtectus]